MDYPDRIYKYRNFQSPVHLRILTHQEIFFAKPGDLNDPFDLRIPVRFWHGTESQLRAFFSELGKNHGYYIEDLTERAKWIDEQVEKRIRDKPPTAEQQYENEFLLTSLSVQNYGVFCASRSPFISTVWSHYSHNHSGFCVGINLQILEEQARAKRIYDDKNRVIFHPEKVDYVETMPFITPYKDREIVVPQYELTLKTKHIHWSYESETRLISTDHKLEEHGLRSLKIPPNAIEEIYLGLNIDKYDKIKIIDILKQKKLTPKVFEMRRKIGAFELEAIRIKID